MDQGAGYSDGFAAPRGRSGEEIGFRVFAHEHEEQERMSSDEEPDRDQALIPGLPRGVAQSCLARVPRGLYPRLRLVSRQWNQALRPDQIFSIRSNDGISEPWLYITLAMGGPFFALDPILMAWHRLPAFPADQIFTDNDKECFVAGRELLVVGPSFYNFRMHPVIWRYRADRNEWSAAPPMTTPRCQFASASFGGMAYVAGGAGFGTSTPLRDAEVYCSGAGRWRALPPMHTARKECSGFVMDGCFYVIGGTDGRDQPVTAGERFDPRTRRWTVIPGLWPESSVSRFRGSVAPPLVAVVGDVLYAWDHPNGLLKRYEKFGGRWTVLDAAAGRRANAESHGWGLGFKGVGEEVWLIGGSELDVPFIDACRPARSGGVLWRRVAEASPVGDNFVYNCAVMKA
ncbi:F-box/kelch-repeat protein At5g60570 [Selaginella moellendorffii]|nr:F-box/kelch-repeat protein At5g60570 [Selaginella moellendorffii]|eukprot:XP_002980775.2 F-box/kelch-repeat protein At5g60570 [Selaginella moellendorffii]